MRTTCCVRAFRASRDLIAVPALINLDFADVKTVMESGGLAHMGIGVGKGENRMVEAAKNAISSPMLETNIDGARAVLINITGGEDMSIIDINEAASLVMQAADSEANIIFGAGIDDSLDDEVRITVIATGFEKTPFPKKEDAKSKNGGERDWTRSFSNGNSGSTYGPSGRQDFSSGSSYEDMSFNMPMEDESMHSDFGGGYVGGSSIPTPAAMPPMMQQGSNYYASYGQPSGYQPRQTYGQPDYGMQQPVQGMQYGNVQQPDDAADGVRPAVSGSYPECTGAAASGRRSAPAGSAAARSGKDSRSGCLYCGARRLGCSRFPAPPHPEITIKSQRDASDSAHPFCICISKTGAISVFLRHK